MERGYSSPADGMACRRGIVAALPGLEPGACGQTKPPLYRLSYRAMLPVSPGCHAAASAFALSSVNERLPCVRIPIRFHSVSRASSSWAYYW